MFLLPPRIRQLFEKQMGKQARLFPVEADMVTLIRQAAQEQGRAEEDVLSDWVNAGQGQSSKDKAAEAKWNSLTEREQEVLALVCLGKRNYVIAESLGIAHETVKTHLQNIFRKFNLRSTKELRLFLQDWDFATWWNSRQI